MEDVENRDLSSGRDSPKVLSPKVLSLETELSEKSYLNKPYTEFFSEK
jgi:hypothetical protein